MLKEIIHQGRVRNRVTCFRNYSGEILDTFYSADILELDGQQCILAVSEDIPGRTDLRLSLARKETLAP